MPGQNLISLLFPLSYIKVSVSTGPFTLLHKHGVLSPILKHVLFTLLPHQHLPLSLLPIITKFLQIISHTCYLGFLCSYCLLNTLQVRFPWPLQQDCSPKSAINSIFWNPRINSQSSHYSAAFDIVDRSFIFNALGFEDITTLVSLFSISWCFCLFSLMFNLEQLQAPRLEFFLLSYQ